MKKFLSAMAALSLAVSLTVTAQPPRPSRGPQGAKDEKAQSEKKDQPEKKEPELKVTPGLYGVSNHEKDWYFDIPDSLLGRRILAVTRFVRQTVGAGQYGGEEVTESMIYWEKAPNGNLLLRSDVM